VIFAKAIYITRTDSNRFKEQQQHASDNKNRANNMPLELPRRVKCNKMFINWDKNVTKNKEDVHLKHNNKTYYHICVCVCEVWQNKEKNKNTGFGNGLLAQISNDIQKRKG
jgi:hypothetical protein